MQHEGNRLISTRQDALSRFALLLLALCLGLSSNAQQPAPEPQPGQEATTRALPPGKKLILTDGTFHLVREYERQGDRVRYYSIERSQWEELPVELVDWEATLQAEREAEQRRAEILNRIQKIRQEELASSIHVDASIEVGPGLFLPDSVGLYVVLDGQILALGQSPIEIKLDKGRLLTTILVPVPVIPTRHRVELPGARATVRLHHVQPEFYLRTADERTPEIELVRARVKGNRREIETINTFFTGDQIEQRQTLLLQRWSVAPRVFRFTLGQSLEAGEYVLVELIPQKGISVFVWDFGVDPLPASPPTNQTPQPSRP
ncbi:MAG: hypothetical protein K6U02_08505 [Firmicutes bacterium]|nr:hypothetical protein [Bacillota bacterium]